MQEAKLYIKNFLESIHKNVPGISFKCEFRHYNNTFVIEVLPIEQYYNHEYEIREYDFSNIFETLYPEYSILFISSDSIIKIKDPIFCIEDVLPSPYINEVQDRFTKSIETAFQPDYQPNTNYALAA